MSFAKTNGSNAYRQIAAHGGVAEADPHKLILMLLDGALQRIAQARGCAQNGASVDATLHLQRAIAIVDELRACLDLSRGEIAANLDNLYEYISRQLLVAMVPSKRAHLPHLAALLGEIRSAWAAIAPDARQAGQPAAPAPGGVAGGRPLAAPLPAAAPAARAPGVGRY
jgi:flagellar protein FliS